jgi:hypothetical protein
MPDLSWSEKLMGWAALAVILFWLIALWWGSW